MTARIRNAAFPGCDLLSLAVQALAFPLCPADRAGKIAEHPVPFGDRCGRAGSRSGPEAPQSAHVVLHRGQVMMDRVCLQHGDAALNSAQVAVDLAGVGASPAVVACLLPLGGEIALPGGEFVLHGLDVIAQRRVVVQGG